MKQKIWVLSTILVGAFALGGHCLAESPANRGDLRWVAVPAGLILEAAKKIKAPLGSGTYTVSGKIACKQELQESPTYRVVSHCRLTVENQSEEIHDAEVLIRALKNKKLGVDKNQLYTMSGEFRAYITSGLGEQAVVAEY